MTKPPGPDDPTATATADDGEAAEGDSGRDPGVDGRSPVVDFYWRPGCPFCMMLKRSLKKRRLPLEYHNIWDDPGAAAVVRSAAGGNETVPTVGIAGHMLVNPSADVVEELLAKVRSGALPPRT